MTAVGMVVATIVSSQIGEHGESGKAYMQRQNQYMAIGALAGLSGGMGVGFAMQVGSLGVAQIASDAQKLDMDLKQIKNQDLPPVKIDIHSKNVPNNESDLMAVSTPTPPPGGKGRRNLENGNTMRRRHVSKGIGGFGIGLRVGNLVWFDIRFNYQGGRKYAHKFPGKNFRWRFKVLSKVKKPNQVPIDEHLPFWRYGGHNPCIANDAR